MTRPYEPILFPDAEALVRQFLVDEYAARSESASVHIRVPNPRPDRFTLTPRVGGIRASLVVDAPQFAFECWDVDDQGAENLAMFTRALVLGLPGRVLDGHQVYRVTEIGGPANLPDSRSDQSRYVFSTSVYLRGTAL